MSEILRDLSSPRLIEALEANFTEEMASFGRGLSGASLHQDEELLWFYTGRRHLNGVLYSRFQSEEKVFLDRRIRETMLYFQERHVSLGWVVGPTTRPANLGDYLEAHGMKHTSETPGMAMALDSAELEAMEIEDFEIREAVDQQTLLPLCEVEMRGFGSSEEKAQNYYETYCNVGFGPGTAWRHFIGWRHDVPVAITSLLFHAGVAGIYGVATVPEARQQGIATAMTKQALRQAREMGYHVAVLSPSEMSIRIYQRLGFQHYCTLQHYGWTPYMNISNETAHTEEETGQVKRISLPENARILVVKMAGIGDLLLATPALRALRESYPLARIDLLVTPDSAGLLNSWDAIDHIIVLDKYLFDSPQQMVMKPQNMARLALLWNALREGKYDAVLLLHHLTLPFGRIKHQILMRATGAKWRVGLDNGHGWFLNVRVPDQGFGAMHEAEYNMEVVKAVGASVQDKRLFLPLSEEERAKARQLIYGESDPDEISRPIIAIHPGTGGYSTARRWAPERFAQVADRLYQAVGGQLLLIGGPEEVELHTQIMGMLKSGVPVRSLAGKGNIKVAGAVLELVDLFIGNDAGPMHLAAAAGAPVVAIFGLSNHLAWGPYTGEAGSKRASVVRLDLPCMPCFYRGHELGTPEGCMTRDCLAMLEIDPVEVAARRMLRGMGARSQVQESL